MPISKDAIDRFLKRVLADLPQFKGADPDQLLRMIYNATGAHYTPAKTQPRPHQLEGIAWALHQRSALLLYWMQLGKSLCALEWTAHLRKSHLIQKKCLVLAHAPVGVDVWENQIITHSNLTASMIRAGPRVIDDLVAALEGPDDCVIISQSMVKELFTDNRPNRKGEPTLYPAHGLLAMAADYFDHCIIDETHYYGNPYGLPFELARGITAGCKYRLGLTGTPIGRDPFPLWAQTALIDQGNLLGRQFEFFRVAFGKQVYSHFTRDQKAWVFDARKMGVLQYKLDRLALSYSKNEITSAPVTESRVELRMHADQRKAYNDAVNRLIKLTGQDDQEIRAIFVRLRQIASGYLPFEDAEGIRRIMHMKSIKLDWLTEYIANIPGEAQCLIFHEYIHTGELIAGLLKKAKVNYGEYRGESKNKPGTLEQFKSGKTQFLVANSASGGTSISLPMVDYLCFFESPVSPQIRAQAAARPMARGTKPLMLADLVCAPVEAKVLSFIAEGDNLLRTLLRGDRKTARDLFAR